MVKMMKGPRRAAYPLALGFAFTLGILAGLPKTTLADSSSTVAGKVVLSAGPAFLQTDQGPTPLSRGAELVPGQTVITGEGGFIHVRMSDGGLVAVRPLSVFQLEVFDYRNDASKDRVRYRLEEGAARSITGVVGDTNKEAFRLNTPVAAVGVRGTDFVVATDAGSSRVAVNSGAVVVAALGNGCAVNGFGACVDNGLLLGKASSLPGQYVEVVRGEHLPRMVHDPATSPDRLAPPHAQEPRVRAASNVEPESDEPIRAAVTTAEIGVSQPAVVVEPAVIGDAIPTPTTPPPVAVAMPTDAYWGRWSSVDSIDDSSVSRVSELLARGKTMLVVNSAYGAGLDAMPSDLPRAGRADFVAAGGEGLLFGANGNIPLQVGAGTLGVNFDNHSFQTQARFDGNGQSYFTNAAGNVDSRGFLRSDPALSDSRVTGALGKDLDSAVTVVERGYSDGMLSGVVVWGRQ